MLDPVAGSLERYMDLLAARQKLVASNIANAETPGYRTVDIDFESEFRSLVEGAGEGAPPPELSLAPFFGDRGRGVLEEVAVALACHRRSED